MRRSISNRPFQRPSITIRKLAISLVNFWSSPWKRKRSRKFGPSHMMTKTELIQAIPVSDYFFIMLIGLPIFCVVTSISGAASAKHQTPTHNNNNNNHIKERPNTLVGVQSRLDWVWIETFRIFTTFSISFPLNLFRFQRNHYFQPLMIGLLTFLSFIGLIIIYFVYHGKSRSDFSARKDKPW